MLEISVSCDAVAIEKALADNYAKIDPAKPYPESLKPNIIDLPPAVYPPGSVEKVVEAAGKTPPHDEFSERF